MRDFELEENLQNLLERGGNIWAIGDVHGFFQTLEKMVQNLHLNDGDAVVMLGDLIDRGPTSAQVVDYVRRTEGFHSIRGNHEHMMIQGFDESSFFKHRSMDSRIWYHNGGKSTEASYLSFYGDDAKAREEASADTKWMESLATEIVLEDWRLVHAGYDQNLEVEEQDEDHDATPDLSADAAIEFEAVKDDWLARLPKTKAAKLLQAIDACAHDLEVMEAVASSAEEDATKVRAGARARVLEATAKLRVAR